MSENNVSPRQQNSDSNNSPTITTRVVGVLVGLIVGGIVIALIESISSMMHPPPTELDFQDTEAVRNWISELPTLAFCIVLIAHALGVICGALTCQLIVKRRWLTGPLIIGTLFLVGGIFNLMLIPHPIWFAITDVALYLPSAWIGGNLLAAKSTTTEQA